MTFSNHSKVNESVLGELTCKWSSNRWCYFSAILIQCIWYTDVDALLKQQPTPPTSKRKQKQKSRLKNIYSLPHWRNIEIGIISDTKHTPRTVLMWPIHADLPAYLPPWIEYENSSFPGLLVNTIAAIFTRWWNASVKHYRLGSVHKAQSFWSPHQGRGPQRTVTVESTGGAWLTMFRYPEEQDHSNVPAPSVMSRHTKRAIRCMVINFNAYHWVLMKSVCGV